MTGKIAFALCEHYMQEAQLVQELEKIDHVILVPFPARCGRPPLTHDEFSALISPLVEVDQVEVLGGCCLTDLSNYSAEGYSTCIHKLDLCFQVVADQALIHRYLSKGAYLTTPGWLAGWPDRLEQLGLNKDTAREMFSETTTRIVLLDTESNEHSATHLEAFASYIDRPFEVLYIGVSRLRFFITKRTLVWQIEAERKKAAAALQYMQQQSAQHAMAIDLLSRLARITHETEAVETMLEVYVSLFAPKRLFYLGFRNGLPDRLWVRPETGGDDAEKEAIHDKLAAFHHDAGYTQTSDGFTVRIVQYGETRGVLAVEQIAFPENLDQYLNLALSIVNICELPIENARKYEKIVRTEEQLQHANKALYELSTMDALTGIANRRAYDNRMDLEWKKMLRNQTTLAFILCDIDYFKAYNDHYGHEAGDQCLHAIAQNIQQAIRRPGDFVARYGGEEFAVILPDTSTEGAVYIAEKIRMAVVQDAISHNSSDIAPYVTLSLGVVGINPPLPLGMSSESLFREADAALYEAKRQGRNRSIKRTIHA